MELIDYTLGGILEKWVREQPDHEFMIYPDRGLRFSYKEFDERTDNLARGLLAYRGDGYCRMVLLVGILASVAFSALFYSEILYINTVGSVVFWTTLGYVVVRFRQAEGAALSETGEKGGANE